MGKNMAEPAGRKTPHPRRPPAHKSVSLRQSRPVPAPAPASGPRWVAQTSRMHRINQALASSSDGSKNSKNSSLNPENSGESSNAEKWFEKSNNRIQGRLGDADAVGSPFYLRNNSSSETPPETIEARAREAHRLGLTFAQLQDHSFGQTPGSLEDFRGIVDDLTVENKKLKRRLRKYEKTYDAHLQQEKLFEIKTYGLSASKKRKLEDMLRTFASSLGDSPKQTATDSTASSLTPAKHLHPTLTSSRTSTKFADSAYVSNSASDQTSQAAIGKAQHKSQMSKTSAARRRQDIQSYLHDIPSGLLPRQPIAMTEKTKKKLVVRRLEQIFAGKGAALGGHQQPQQQQEVSHSAAFADRMAIEASGMVPRAEGHREAQILGKTLVEQTAVLHSPHTPADTEKTGHHAPEQRPTRPLDLDLYRAQVPQDNIEYIRHLGFSPADAGTEMADLSEANGWIYLNVLTNMAQLHTLNVTNDFVKQSIMDYSQKIALSRDGRKARWKGGQDVTSTSGDGSPNSGTGSHSPARKKKRSTDAGSSGSHSDDLTRLTGMPSNDLDKLAYVPLFSHKQSTESDGTSEEVTSSWGLPWQDHATGDSSGFTSSGMRTTSSKRKRDTGGPIIFYNGAKFCTDLSGDQGEQVTEPRSNVEYSAVSSEPLGAPPDNVLSSIERRPVVRGSVAEEFMDLDDDNSDANSQSSGKIDFSPARATSTDVKECLNIPPFKLEASGLGGVQPDDNFQLIVRSAQQTSRRKVPARAVHFPGQKNFRAKAFKLPKTGPDVSPRSARPAVLVQVVSVDHTQLAPSVLPDPAPLFNFSSVNDDESMPCFGEDGDESGFGDGDGDGDGDNGDEDDPPLTVPQMLNFDFSQSDNSVYDDDGSDDSNDEENDGDDGDDEVDLLATARALDPLTVHEREREFAANMAERVAEEIPAGSSAATAGGGSGFSSPE